MAPGIIHSIAPPPPPRPPLLKGGPQSGRLSAPGARCLAPSARSSEACCVSTAFKHAGVCSTASRQVYINAAWLRQPLLPRQRQSRPGRLWLEAPSHLRTAAPWAPEQSHGRLGPAVPSWSRSEAPPKSVAGSTAFPPGPLLTLWPSSPRTVACSRLRTAALMGGQGAAHGTLRARAWCGVRGARGTLSPQTSLIESLSSFSFCDALSYESTFGFHHRDCYFLPYTYGAPFE